MENADISQLSQMPLVSLDKAYQYLQSLNYDDSEGIMFVEEQLYNLLQSNPDDINFLALLMHEQIMKSKGQRARSIAYKIWESGGDMLPDIEKMYIDDLMNLCMLDMAGAALAPAISDLDNSMREWSMLLLKYAVISGNMELLERVLAYFPDDRNSNILRDWVDLNSHMKVSSQISGIMSRIFERIQDMMLGFSYNVYSDRDFPDVEFVFYVDNETKDAENLMQMLNMQISLYCAQRKIQDLTNLSCVVYPISRFKKD